MKNQCIYCGEMVEIYCTSRIEAEDCANYMKSELESLDATLDRIADVINDESKPI